MTKWLGLKIGVCNSSFMAASKRRVHFQGRCCAYARVVPFLLCLALFFYGHCAIGETTRIVSLLPNFTETLFSIGAGSMVAGVSDFCKYPPAATQIPKVGGLINPSLEKIVSLQPTAVVVSASQHELARKLSELGVRTFALRSDSLRDIYDAIELAGRLTGMTTAAEQLRLQVRKELTDVRDSCTSSRKLRVLIVVGRQRGSLQGLYAAGRGSYLSELVELAGGMNVLHDSVPARALSKEELVALNPEVILDFSVADGEPSKFVASGERKVWNALQVMEAVKRDQVYFFPDARFTIPGPSVVETARGIEHILCNKTASR
ncbi:MAG: ABC transporter substrate-binding protein [Candidatus Sumerlaea chitinivorans]|nr:ABC transporter substrate-binding protein [Candidatus Sumerlaea chitinivorans]